jgi:hypothetical protein
VKFTPLFATLLKVDSHSQLATLAVGIMSIRPAQPVASGIALVMSTKCANKSRSSLGAGSCVVAGQNRWIVEGMPSVAPARSRIHSLAHFVAAYPSVPSRGGTLSAVQVRMDGGSCCWLSTTDDDSHVDNITVSFSLMAQVELEN